MLTSGGAGMVLGLYFFLEPEQCVQAGAVGECLRTRVPSEGARLQGIALAGLSLLATGLGVAVAVVADSMWQALGDGRRAERNRLLPWVYADADGAAAGAVLSW